MNIHLVNFPNIRVKKYAKGYSVEIEQTKRFLFWTKKQWIHIEAWSGLHHEPFYFKTKEFAIEEASQHFKWDLIINSNE